MHNGRCKNTVHGCMGADMSVFVVDSGNVCVSDSAVESGHVVASGLTRPLVGTRGRVTKRME